MNELRRANVASYFMASTAWTPATCAAVQGLLGIDGLGGLRV